MEHRIEKILQLESIEIGAFVIRNKEPNSANQQNDIGKFLSTVIIINSIK